MNLRSQLEGMTVRAVDARMTAIGQMLVSEREKVAVEIAELRNNSESAISEIDARIAAQESKAKMADECLAIFDRREQGLKRDKELKEQETSLSAQYEQLQSELFLMEKFIRAKVSMLTEKINSRFSLASFRLFEEQVNGGLQEVCEATFAGVPYSSLNNGARVNIGLDIINVLSEHTGFAPPIFIDNAESVTRLIETRGQKIRLVVSELDKTLRFEAHDRASEPQGALI